MRSQTGKHGLGIFTLFAVAGAAALFGSAAQAGGLLFEPYVGYAFTKGSSDYSIPALSFVQTRNLDVSNPVLGGRIGFDKILMFGVEGVYEPKHDINTKVTNGTTLLVNGNLAGDNEKLSVKEDLVGAFLGVDAPFVRIWGTYYFVSKMKVAATSAAGLYRSGDKLGGNGYGAGIGFKMIPFVSLNFDYRSLKFKDKGESFGPVAGYGAKLTEYVASLSFPFLL